MFDPLLTGPFVPFTFALALLTGLLILELILGLIGGSLMTGDSDFDLDIDAPDLGDLDLDIDLDGLNIDPADLELGDATLGVDDPDAPEITDAAPAAWLGFGKMPFMIWLASMLMGFGVTGYVLQSVLNGVLGFTLPAGLAAIPAAIIAVGFTRRFGAIFARLLPKTETQSLSERHLGRRAGIVTQGTAARGRPAEIRVTDRYGNTHYLRAEPLRDDAQIPQGSEVIVLRHRIEGGYFIVPLT
ncbi:MAG: YqiJ family protein [Pelagimonas sp.]|jgi:hypothetical protein|nr:YqiJ family protein [Pelagimonas sp.]